MRRATRASPAQMVGDTTTAFTYPNDDELTTTGCGFVHSYSDNANAPQAGRRTRGPLKDGAAPCAGAAPLCVPRPVDAYRAGSSSAAGAGALCR
jgi:hypothetical protein